MAGHDNTLSRRSSAAPRTDTAAAGHGDSSAVVDPSGQAEGIMAAMPDDMEIVTSVYREGNKGDIPVVLLHAFPVDHRVWDRCAQELIRISEEEHENYPIFAPDMPGAGMSPLPEPGLTGPVGEDGSYPEACSRLAASIVMAIKDMGYDRAVWVGISMGGYLALAIQRLFPESVAGFVLCDTRAEEDAPEARAGRLGIASEALESHSVSPVLHFARPQKGDSAFKQSAEFVDTFTRWIDEQSPAGLAWRERMAAGRRNEVATLSSVTAPAAVVSGELDRSSGPSVMRPVAEAMVHADVKFYEIRDSGHFSCFEKPQEVALAIEDVARRASQTVRR